MAKYEDLIAQAQALMAQAEQVRKQELADVLSNIKEWMTDYNITIDELAAYLGTRKAAKPSRTKGEAKYRGPNGELWSGGPGRKPGWVQEVFAAGKSLDQYLI